MQLQDNGKSTKHILLYGKEIAGTGIVDTIYLCTFSAAVRLARRQWMDTCFAGWHRKLGYSRFIYSSQPCDRDRPCTPGYSCKPLHTAAAGTHWIFSIPDNCSRARWFSFLWLVLQESKADCSLRLLAQDPIAGNTFAALHQITSWRQLWSLSGITDKNCLLDVWTGPHTLL